MTHEAASPAPASDTVQVEVGPDDMIAIGTRLQQVGLIDAAARSFYHALEADPDHRVAAAMLAEALAEGADPARLAEEAAERLEDLIIAQHLHRLGRLEAAEAGYRAILAGAPNFADAHHFLGVLRYERGDALEAIEHIRRSLELASGSADWWCNYANVLRGAGRAEDAAEAYRKTLERDANHITALNNLGSLLFQARRYQAAEKAFRTAHGLDPLHPGVQSNLADLLFKTGRLAEAAELAARSIALRPEGYPWRRELLAWAYEKTGRRTEAITALRAWVAAEPESPRARHMLAAFGGEAVPARAADAYVSDLFDNVAADFDEKLAGLGYRAPELVASALAEAAGPARGALDILDAGVGTGLCGPLLRAYARRFDGVDLSAGMLEKARARGLYDRLDVGELTADLLDHPGAYDAVISADTLVYFGALETVLAAARRALRAGGFLVFTLEKAPTDVATPYRLNANGRYCHREDAVRSALADAGFATHVVAHAILRHEAGAPVDGLVVTAHVQQ